MKKIIKKEVFIKIIIGTCAIIGWELGKILF